MRRDHLLMIWIGGLVLAVLLYAIGPDRFVDAVWGMTDAIDAAARNLVAELGARTYGVVRASAIAIYIVFAVLAVLASQRGHRGMWALTVVSAACMVLIWRPFGFYPAPLSRWLTALILVVIGAAVMTRRLTVSSPLPRSAVPPYPSGRP